MAHVFLAEYHRLLADAHAREDRAEQALGQRRAFTWRVTAGRIPHVPAHSWPAWLLDHLADVADTPVIGGEYARQRQVLEQALASAPVTNSIEAPEGANLTPKRA